MGLEEAVWRMDEVSKGLEVEKGWLVRGSCNVDGK